jgi:hypothetical protein
MGSKENRWLPGLEIMRRTFRIRAGDREIRNIELGLHKGLCRRNGMKLVADRVAIRDPSRRRWNELGEMRAVYSLVV